MANDDDNTTVTVSRRSFLGAATAAPVLAAPVAAAGEGLSPDAALRRAWTQATYDAAALRRDANRLRTSLTRRIGPRAVTLGMVLLPDGQTFPIQISTTNEFYRLLRLIPVPDQPAMQAAFPAVQDAVSATKKRWDTEATRCGLPTLEHHANAAHDRAKSLLARLLSAVESA